MAIKRNNFNVDKNGNMTCNNAVMQGKINATSGKIGSFEITSYGSLTTNGYSASLTAESNGLRTQINPTGLYFDIANGNSLRNTAKFMGGYNPEIMLTSNDVFTVIKSDLVQSPTILQASTEKIKKNIKDFKHGLKIVKESNIFTYNLKTESETDKKHIGFIIGEKYSTPSEVIAKTSDSIDLYAMTSILWQAVKELTEKVEDLENKLEGGQEWENT